MAVIEREQTMPQAMRMMTKVDYVDESHGQRVVGQDLVISAQQPANMRITVSAFDKAVSTLVTDGTGFSLMDVSQNVYITGLATPENIARILPVYLSARDLYRVIYGQFPMDGVDNADEFLLEWDEEKGGYCKTLSLKNGFIEKVYYDWPKGDIFLITVSDGDSIIYTYEASAFKTYTANHQSWRYPNQILFKLPKQKTDVRLRVEKRDMDVEFSDAVFQLLPPEGARLIVLDSLEPESSGEEFAQPQTEPVQPQAEVVSSEVESESPRAEPAPTEAEPAPANGNEADSTGNSETGGETAAP